MRAYALLGLLVIVAGCIELPQDPDADTAVREPSTGGKMSATETKTEKSELCTDLNLQSDERFCAERVITVSGAVSGFDLLDVDLETFNGEVSVSDASGDSWSVVTTLKARGSSAADAMAKVDDIAFRWAHEDATGHFVEVVAEHDGNTESRSASIALKMPRAIVMRLAASTSNGDITFEKGRTDGISLSTSNGKVHAQGEVTQVSLSTSNGEIDADLRPAGSGRWTLSTSNGDVTLKVPEGDAYGYSMEGSTSNGEVDFTLRDGTEGPCPEGSQYYTPPCNHRTFETGARNARDHQVNVDLSTSNGDIGVGPA